VVRDLARTERHVHDATQRADAAERTLRDERAVVGEADIFLSGPMMKTERTVALSAGVCPSDVLPAPSGGMS
jgi:hypothetical protein